MDDEIVDAHGDEIDTDRIVNAAFDCDLDLRSDAIIGRHKNGIAKTRRFEVEKPAEAADFGVGAAPAGRPHQRFDLFDQCIAGIDVDPGGAVLLGLCAVGQDLSPPPFY